MGLPISIDIPSAGSANPFKAAFERFEDIDQRFSTYRPTSEVSKFINGRVGEPALSRELKFVIEQCKGFESATDGYFSAWAGGTFDPSGYVKGWAIAEAAKEIEKQGIKTYCIGAGGDILARSDSDKVWQIGIQDPVDKTKILDKSSISNGGVATSGSYSRGSHIFNPKTRKTVNDFLSVTIIGPDIVTADVLATAVYAAGKQGEAILKKHPDYQALIIRRSRGSNP